jgi:protein gp37
LKYRDNNTGQSVWHCVKISPGCASCYSEALAVRYDRGGPFNRTRLQTVTPFIDAKEIRHVLNAKAIKKIPVAGKRCFPFDMTDVFGDWVTDDQIDVCFAAFATRKDITFQVLTKRTDRMLDYVSGLYRDIASVTVPRLLKAAKSFKFDKQFLAANPGPVFDTPIQNLWLGTSIENSQMMRGRAPLLAQVQAKVRFWSIEPLLEVLDDVESVMRTPVFPGLPPQTKNPKMNRSVDWAILGGESGTGARPMPEDAILPIVHAAKAVGIPLFVKQLGSVLGRFYGGGKGNDPSKWMESYRVREWPQ